MRALLIVIFLAVNFTSFAQTSSHENDEPFVLGRINRIQSTVLDEERILNIYLPEGYNGADTTNYPVVYLLDGSADEDFIHIAGLLQFVNFPWVNIYP